MNRYSLMCIAALSLVVTGCSKTEAQDQNVVSLITQGFDDGSTLSMNRSTGERSSTPWTAEGAPFAK